MDGYVQKQYKDLEQLTDEALCLELQSGNAAAGDILAYRYRRLVRCCAHPYFLAGGDSEDLLQEGMIGLIKAMREFRPIGKPVFKPLPRSASAAACAP